MAKAQGACTVSPNSLEGGNLCMGRWYTTISPSFVIKEGLATKHRSKHHLSFCQGAQHNCVNIMMLNNHVTGENKQPYFVKCVTKRLLVTS